MSFFFFSLNSLLIIREAGSAVSQSAGMCCVMMVLKRLK